MFRSIFVRPPYTLDNIENRQVRPPWTPKVGHFQMNELIQ